MLEIDPELGASLAVPPGAMNRWAASAERMEGAMMAAKFEIYTDKAGKYRFRLKAGNGEVVATGEAYESKAGAIKGVDAVTRAAAAAEIADTTA